MMKKEKNLIERLVLRPWFWLLVVGFTFSVPLMRSILREPPEKLPIFATLPNYSFKDQKGNSFGSKELKGKAYIANFFFSKCPSTCPELMKKMNEVQRRIRGVTLKTRMVSFTVDPKFDRPNVLLKQATKYKANNTTWRFLTSSEEDVENLLTKGFMVAMGKSEETDNIYDLAHSEKFALVDEYGRIRGYYPSDKLGITKLMIDLGVLLQYMEG